MPSETYVLPPKKHRLRAAARVLFGTIWALFAAELFLRLFAQQPLMPRNVSASDFGIRVNTPNTVYWQRTPEVTVQVRINGQGIRADEEIPLEKPPGVKRIVVLGDSYGMGYEVDLKDAFTTQMANRLREAGEHVQIVNLSVSGYGNAEELLMLEHRGFAFHPDLVLLAWHQTDIDDNVRCELYALRGNELVRDKATYLPGVRTRQLLDHIPGYGWIEANSELYSFLRERAAKQVKALLLALHGNPAPAAATTSQRAPAVAPTTAPAVRPYPERLVAALLKRIQDESAAHHCRLLILDIPSQLTRTDFYSQFPRAAVDEVGSFDVVSPLPAFRAYRGEKLFWEKGHFHFTVLGCRVVGKVLADHILKDHLLDEWPRSSPSARP